MGNATLSACSDPAAPNSRFELGDPSYTEFTEFRKMKKTLTCVGIVMCVVGIVAWNTRQHWLPMLSGQVGQVVPGKLWKSLIPWPEDAFVGTDKNGDAFVVFRRDADQRYKGFAYGCGKVGGALWICDVWSSGNKGGKYLKRFAHRRSSEAERLTKQWIDEQQ